MKLLENILLAFCVTSLAIGVHQVYHYEVQEVYWILSLSVLLFLVYTYVRSKNAEKEKSEAKDTVSETNNPQNKNTVSKDGSNYTPPKKKRKKK